MRHVLSGREQVLGPRHPDTIAARVSLADACQQSGQVKEAIVLGKRTLADQERALGPGHPETIAAATSLPSALKTTALRRSPCANRANSRPVRASKTRAVLSAEPVATRPPPGLKATATTRPR